MTNLCHLQSTGRPAVTSEKTLTDLKRMVRYVTDRLPEAELRKVDLAWWTKNSATLIEELTEALRLRALSEAELTAEVEAAHDLDAERDKELGPRAAYIVPFVKAEMRAKLLKARVTERREWARSGAWSLYIYGFILGFERIEAEALHKPTAVLRARGVLRGGVSAMGVFAGTHRVVDDNPDGDWTDGEDE